MKSELIAYLNTRHNNLFQHVFIIAIWRIIICKYGWYYQDKNEKWK
jgi:hypothetical protein